MKTPRRRIQKARRRAEKRAAAVARYMKGRNARLAEFDAQLRAVPGFVETFRRGPNGDTLTPYQRGIVERLRGAGQVVVVVDSRYASTTPCDCDPSDDTKGAPNVRAAAARTPLVLRKSDCLDDWYVIERRNSFEQLVEGSTVEGTAQHMLAIADAIQCRSEHTEKRCAVQANCGDAAFWSPKNSKGAMGTVTLEDADELAAQIVAELGERR
jgi:hypothetical protein